MTSRCAGVAPISPATAAAPSTLTSPITTSAPSAASRARDRRADPAGAAGDQRPASLEPHRRAGGLSCAGAAPGTAACAAKRSRSSAAPARSATGSRCAGPRAGHAVVIGSRSEERAAETARKLSELAPDAEIEGLAQRARGQAGADRLPHRPLPRPVGEPQQPARGARARPAAGRLHGAARRRGQRQGDPLARRLAGLGRPAGPGDGPRRASPWSPRCTRSARRRSPTPAPTSTRTCCSAATARPTRRGSRALIEAIAGPARGQRRAARDGADRRAADADADLDQRPLQDPRRDPDQRPARRRPLG